MDTPLTSDLAEKGMGILSETLGLIEFQIFIIAIKHKEFDYIKWQRDHIFEDEQIEELLEFIAGFEQDDSKQHHKKGSTTNSSLTSAFLIKGMEALYKTLGVAETEIFITTQKQGKFDYTKWREALFEDMTLEELVANAAKFERENPDSIPKNATLI